MSVRHVLVSRGFIQISRLQIWPQSSLKSQQVIIIIIIIYLKHINVHIYNYILSIYKNSQISIRGRWLMFRLK